MTYEWIAPHGIAQYEAHDALFFFCIAVTKNRHQPCSQRANRLTAPSKAGQTDTPTFTGRYARRDMMPTRCTVPSGFGVCRYGFRHVDTHGAAESVKSPAGNVSISARESITSARHPCRGSPPSRSSISCRLVTIGDSTGKGHGRSPRRTNGTVNSVSRDVVLHAFERTVFARQLHCFQYDRASRNVTLLFGLSRVISSRRRLRK